MKKQIDVGEGYYLTFRQVSNGYGGYHPVNIVINRYDDEWYYAEVADKFGNFNDSPEFEPGKWVKKLEMEFYTSIQFTFQMSDFKDGKSMVVWLLQPDGRYFSDDDGFGEEDYDEIELYSIMDATGHFLRPFTEKKIDGWENFHMLW